MTAIPAPSPPPDGDALGGPVDAHGPGRSSLLALSLGSIGVVYGDIGTSPLYAFREALHAAGHGAGVAPPRETVLGVLSLIFWALFLIVTIKYVLILLKADNNGEGGTLSLMALAQRAMGHSGRYVFTLGVIGAALFYGDSVLTPAISVLSAVEGLKLLTPAFEPYVLSITVLILVILFAVQSRGTGKVAAFFGPLMLVWFAVIGVMGASHIADEPGVFAAFNPVHGLVFLGTHGKIGLVTLGSVFLAVTGGEALYADLGHFGRRPIQWAWFAVVLPALMLNYLGQGALVLANPEASRDPFFLMAPAWGLAPLVVLATAATVIASQAVITGAFSLTRQAIQLGLLPRLEIRHTSASHSGQIYLPRINTLLLIGVLFLVVTFRSSTSLASAYGISVTGAMVIDALLCIVVIWRVWGWPVWGAALLMIPFLVIDLAFFGANLFKFFDGGYIPLTLAAALIVLMLTWVKGSGVLTAKTHKDQVPLADLLRNLEKRPPHVVKGTAIFLTGDPNSAPTALMHNLKHNRVLHERNIVLTIRAADTPRVPDSERVSIQPFSERFTRVNMTFGYMETPSVPKGLALCRKKGLTFDIMSTSFFLSRRSIKPDPRTGMPLWQDKLFISAARAATDATAFFQIPSDRVVEIGTRVTV